MKRILILAMAGLAALASHAQGTWSTNISVNLSVPDNDANGLISSVHLDANGWTVGSVTLDLNVSGGYNGDLYAYLSGPGGGFSVLLNRVGMNSGSSVGYANAGFNVTLDDSSPNDIHITGGSYTLGSGQVSGVFKPDGRNIPPNSDPSAFDASGTAFLTAFAGKPVTGDWTLFVADVVPGSQGTLVSWGLNVVTIPEPGTWTMLGCGVLLLVGIRKLRSAG